MEHWQFYTPANYEANEPNNLHYAPKPRHFAPNICTGNDSSRPPSTPFTGQNELLLFPSPPTVVEELPRTVQGSTYNGTCPLPIDGVSLLNSNIADCARTLSNDVEKLKVTDVACWRASIEDSSYRATHQRAAWPFLTRNFKFISYLSNSTAS